MDTSVVAADSEVEERPRQGTCTSWGIVRTANTTLRAIWVVNRGFELDDLVKVNPHITGGVDKAIELFTRYWIPPCDSNPPPPPKPTVCAGLSLIATGAI